MSATLIDGKAISEAVRKEWKERVDKLKAKGVLPGLAVIIVGDNPASKLYVNNKVKACHDVGLHSEVHDMPEDSTEEMLLKLIDQLNKANKINGILVQLPLPKHIDENKVLEAINKEKDVDGFHLYNVGALMTGNTVFPPCTPFGVMCMLKYCKVPISGKNAVVIGRSNIVGKPMAMMLLQEDATVTICTSKTKDLVQHTKQADILVVATGRPEMIKAEHIKEGAVIIDVGINRLDSGKLVGDVDFDSVKEIAGYITPVPGGVGPMTITMLVANTIKAAENNN